MKFIIAAGGTAGHINPALSIADEIKKRFPDAEILFIGREAGMEGKLVPLRGYAFENIDVSGISRKKSPVMIAENMRALSKYIKARARCTKLIKELLPDAVIGTGGFVSAPVLRAAAKLGFKTAIQEQNAFPGVTTKMLAPHVDVVMTVNEQSKLRLEKAKRCEVTGNPVSDEILCADRVAARKRMGIKKELCILSFAGSLGADRMNEVVAQYTAWHLKNRFYHHIHATGSYGVELFPSVLVKAGVTDTGEYKNLDCREYIYDMPECLAAADIVICRAGAITISELTALGKPAILVPSPNVAENHQYYNALALSQRGAAVLIEEKDFTPEKLTEEAEALLSDGARRIDMGLRAREMGRRDATARITDIILSL